MRAPTTKIMAHQGARGVARPPKELTKEQLRSFRGRFVTHLKALMAERGIPDTATLSEKSGVKEPTIRKWFRCECNAEPESIERIAKALGIDDYRLVYPPPRIKRKRS